MATKEQSNPYSTGGGGVNFEVDIQSAFACLMLTQTSAPGLPPWPIEKIKLQGKYDGYETDDFIVFANNPKTDAKAKLFSQIKHAVSITKTDETFGEVIQAAWNDFTKHTVFDPTTDSFALITGPMSASDIANVRPLLEWARHSEDAKDFLRKVTSPGFSSDAKRRKLAAFQTQLQAANNGDPVSDDDFWQFMKCFHLLPYDLDVDSGSTYPLLLAMLSNLTSGTPEDLWARLGQAIRSANQTAGTLLPEELARELDIEIKAGFNRQWFLDHKKLKDRGDFILGGIKSDIGGITIPRDDSICHLQSICEEADFVFIQGERGCGKSSLVRQFLAVQGDTTPIYCLRAEDLDQPHLDAAFTHIGLNASLRDLETGFAFAPKKFLVIESLEKLLELRYTSGFTDLLMFLSKQTGWTVIASGRDYAHSQIISSFLDPNGVNYKSVPLAGFSDKDVDFLCEQLEPMEQFKNNAQLKSLFINPYMANLAYQVSVNGARLKPTDGEQAFRAAIWREYISKESDRKNGLPIKRKKAFIEISVQRAKNMVYGVSDDGFDPDVLFALENDQLIRRDSDTETVSPAHDVLEDFALEKYIDDAYQKGARNPEGLMAAVGTEPAMNRAFRMWLANKFKFDDSIWEFISNLLEGDACSGMWKDEAITALLLAKNPYDVFEKLKETLFADNGELIKRFCLMLRIAAKKPDSEIRRPLSKHDKRAIPRFLKPDGAGWDVVIRFLYENKERLDETYFVHVLAVLDDWSYSVSITSPATDAMRMAGLLGLHILQFSGSSYRRGSRLEELFSVILKTTVAIGSEIIDLFKQAVLDIEDDRNRPDYASSLLKLSLTNPITVFLCKYQPQLVVDVAWKVWMIDRCPLPDLHGHFWGGYSHSDVDADFGINKHRSGADFFSASGAKGPFQPLFIHHPRLGLDFILRLCNFSADAYVVSDLDAPSEFSGMWADQDTFRQAKDITVEVLLPNGQVVNQYCTQRLWSGYRGTTVLPDLLQSVLMALENWLVAVVEAVDDEAYLEWLFFYILKESNSVLTTAVLASVAKGFPEKLGRISLPLLAVPEFYEKDLILVSIQEGRGFGGGFGRDAYAEYYAQERRTAAERPWRKENLETLVFRLQFTDLRDDVFKILDQLKTAVADDESWRFRFLRTDIRLVRPEVDKENNLIKFVPKDMPFELKEKQEKTSVQAAQTERFMALTLWADHEFKGEAYKNSRYENWKEALPEAKNLWDLILSGNVRDLEVMQAGSICRAAAVFLRDHGSELKDDDLSWVVEMLYGVILRGADGSEDSIDAMDATDHSGAAAAASVLPVLFDFVKSGEGLASLKAVIAAALTHPNRDVRISVAKGVCEYLWSRDSEFATVCFNGSVEYAKEALEAHKRGRTRYVEQFQKGELSEVTEDNWKVEFREKMVTGNIPEPDLSFTFDTHSGWDILVPCLIPQNGTDDSTQLGFLLRVLGLCVEIEVSEQRYNNNKVSDKLLGEFPERLADFVWDSSEKVREKILIQLRSICKQAPDIVNTFLMKYLQLADVRKSIKSYWDVWIRFSPELGKICAGHKPEEFLPRRERDFDTLVRGYLFYDFFWTRYRPEEYLISPGAQKIAKFCTEHGANPLVFEAYCHLLYSFPDLFIPDGLLALSELQHQVGGSKLMSGTNTVFYLEAILQRYLLDSGEALIPSKMHSACKVLLDALVEQASSNAYFLRERLVRSIRKV